jgi:nucleotide-binding universal stress UspA family protein
MPGHRKSPLWEEFMPLRDILVHLDSTPRTAERLALAVTLARHHDARLVGIFAQRAEAYQVGVVAVWPPESYAIAAAASRAQFDTAIHGLRDAEWVDLNRGSDHEVVHLMTEAARHYDITILGQDDEDGLRVVPRELAEQLIVESGRPILVVPYAGHFPDLGARPLIAWTEARPAARALNDALILLKPGAQVSVASVGLGTESQKSSVERIAAHLRAHKIDAQIEHMQITEVGVMDTLLNLASDKAADFLVMGAFGGYGYPVLSRGSGTRYMLRHMTAPCLFSH